MAIATAWGAFLVSVATWGGDAGQNAAGVALVFTIITAVVTSK